jgi:DNA-directed RNA polymerase subunit RPC12/RpoP
MANLGYVCDNCGNKIQEEPDEINKDNPDWKPEIRVT